MQKILFSVAFIALLTAHNSYASSGDVDLLSDEMFLSDSETAQTDANVDEPEEKDEKSGGIFGFMRPITRFFSGGDSDNTGEEVEKDLFEKLTRSADSGNLDSQMELAYLYLYGIDDVEQDFKKALHYYALAAEQKDPIALNNLGSLYFSGIGTQKDIGKALGLFHEAAELGNDNAALNLAFIYLTGGEKNTERNKKAIELFEKAQKKNNIAKFMLGYAYYRGFVVPQDYEKAFQLIKAAADTPAQIDEAQLILARMYAEGKGTVQNYQNAINSYRAAVAQNNMEAVMELAQIYADGVMCQKNFVLAHSLFNIASSKNIPDAAEKRDALTAEMKLEELTQAQETAQNYQSAPSELTTYIRQTYGSNIRKYIENNM